MNTAILTVTPNPAIDKTAVIPNFRLGEIHRPQSMLALPGGKGLNVARSLRRLGGECHVALLLGRYGGDWMLERLAQEGIHARAAWHLGEQRACLSVVDPVANSLTEIYENSASVPAESWQEFEALVAVMAQQAGWVALCGSLPEGAPAGGMARLVEACRAAPAAQLVVDTGGKNLAPLLAAGPWLVKVNRHEAGELLGDVPCSLSEGVAACRAIQQRGAQSVVITFGSQGVAGVDVSGSEFCWIPPEVPAVSAVGSGDALLAGMLIGLGRGESLGQAARLGTAAGAANALSIGAGCFSRDEVERLFWRVKPGLPGE
jgi:1-phosphofructokinase family hexose kinase